MDFTNPLGVVWLILGWGLVVVVALVVIAVITALMAGIIRMFTTDNGDDKNGGN